jgi:hypothetical protein
MSEPAPVCHLCGTVIYDSQLAVTISTDQADLACLTRPQPMIGPHTNA